MPKGSALLLLILFFRFFATLLAIGSLNHRGHGYALDQSSKWGVILVNFLKILKHLGLWEIKGRPPPRIHSPPAELYADYSDSQIPPWDDNYSDPDYGSTELIEVPFEAYM